MAGVGSGSGIGESPADVLFWLHHANIDRIWAQWQATHNDHPALTGENAQLDPWYDAFSKKLTEKDTRNTDILGYLYQ
jgi:tyrosinase